jgi:polar amino acid transport system permease protein
VTDPAPVAGSAAGPPVVPLRHPWRWVGTAVMALLVAMFVHMLVTNDAFQWTFMVHNMFRRPVLDGARTSVYLTLTAMAAGLVGGVVLAVMRLSPSPVLSGVAWAYTWFFRAVPRIVLAVLFGNFGILYPRFFVGLPFDHQILSSLGFGDRNAHLFGVDARTIGAGFFAGFLALALSEAAYMAEIIRAGILSVETGQAEAASSLGMGRLLTLRRIVLPQAFPVIVPPTGNETIAMLKDTALVAFVPVTNELFFQLRAVGSRTFNVFPMMIAACLWYLAMTSVLMAGQYFLEKRMAR